MKTLLDNVSVNTAGVPVKVFGPCTIFVGATVWGGGKVTIMGRGEGATNFIVMGELAVVTADKPVAVDVEGPWEAKAVLTDASGTTAGVSAYVNQ